MIALNGRLLIFLFLTVVITNATKIKIDDNKVYYINKGEEVEFKCDTTFGKVFALDYKREGIPIQTGTEIDTASGTHKWDGDAAATQSKFIMYDPKTMKYYVPIFFPIACKKISSRRRLSAKLEKNIGISRQKVTEFRQKILRKLAATDGPWKPNKNFYRRYESAVILGEVDKPEFDVLKPLNSVTSGAQAQNNFIYCLLAVGCAILNYAFL